MKKLLARMLDQNGKNRPDFEEIVKILNINPKLRELEKFEEQISKNNQGCSNEGVMYQLGEKDAADRPLYSMATHMQQLRMEVTERKKTNEKPLYQLVDQGLRGKNEMALDECIIEKMNTFLHSSMSNIVSGKLRMLIVIIDLGVVISIFTSMK